MRFESFPQILSLSAAHEAGIDINAGQIFSNCPMDHGGGDSRIHPSGKRTDGLGFSDLFFYLRNRIFDEILCFSSAMAAIGQFRELAIFTKFFGSLTT